MGKFKRTNKQKAKDFKVMYELRLQNKTFHEITAYLNSIRPYKVGYQANYKLYKNSIEKEVKEQNSNKHVLDLMIDDLDALMQKMLDEWNRSSDDKITITDHGKVNKETGQMVNITRTVTTSPREGNPKFLELYLKAQERKAKLLGLDKSSNNPIEDLLNRITINDKPTRKISQPITSEQLALEQGEYIEHEEL